MGQSKEELKQRINLEMKMAGNVVKSLLNGSSTKQELSELRDITKSFRLEVSKLLEDSM